MNLLEALIEQRRRENATANAPARPIPANVVPQLYSERRKQYEQSITSGR